MATQMNQAVVFWGKARDEAKSPSEAQHAGSMAAAFDVAYDYALQLVAAERDRQLVRDRLAECLRDVFWRATRYGETEDGDTFAYLVTKGAMHRLIAAAQSAGTGAAFRVANDPLPDEAEVRP